MDPTLELLFDLDDEDEDDDEEDERLQQLAVVALILLGAEESRQHRSAQRQRLYLTRPDLLPNPRSNTPWQALWNTRDNRAYLTTMGIDVGTFDYILEAGFADQWDNTPISRPDVHHTGAPRLHARSLDAAGGLGLYLHYLSSSMPATGLSQIFALIPSTVSRYNEFSQVILLRVLQSIPEGMISWPKIHPNGRNEFQEYSNLITVSSDLFNKLYIELEYFIT